MNSRENCVYLVINGDSVKYVNKTCFRFYKILHMLKKSEGRYWFEYSP